MCRHCQVASVQPWSRVQNLLILVCERSAAETLDVVERQRIVRLLVKEVLVSDDTIVIRHCIPVPSGPSPTASGPNGHAGALTDRPSYLLRSGSSSA